MTTKEIRELCDTLDMNDITPDKNQNHLCVIVDRDSIVKSTDEYVNSNEDTKTDIPESIIDIIINSIENWDIINDNKDLIRDIVWEENQE